MEHMLHPRLDRLTAHHIGADAVVLEAGGIRSRLLGLAWLRAMELPERHALLLRPCASLHTFGMRFPIDVVFADAEGRALRVIRDVPPRRLLRCPRAAVALEAHAGEAALFLHGGRGSGARLSPEIPRGAGA
jgi:uncharacterized membrane protein (UPF0127 family)